MAPCFKLEQGFKGKCKGNFILMTGFDSISMV